MIYGIRSRMPVAPRLPAWTVGEVWIAGGPAPDHYVNVTGTFPRRLAAPRAHESQTGHLTDLEARLRERLAASAGRAGVRDGRLAEAFQVLESA